VLDVILDKYGNPLASRGGHAMLIVGYDRTSGPMPYFIVKNSWGTDIEHGGYYHFSYDYLRTYAKYGYIVYNVRQDMSDVPADF
jgi:C1A family cysteine protease